MIAEIYPIKRMPRKFRVFDYKIAENVTLKRGDIVRAPFRTKFVYGVVANVKDKPPRGIRLKTIEEHAVASIREEELSFFEHVARDHAQSVASILHASLPAPPKRASQDSDTRAYGKALTIPRDEALVLSQTVRDMLKRRFAFVTSSDLRRSAVKISLLLEKKADEKIVVICPTVRDANILANSLWNYSPVLLTGAETNNQRFRGWQRFRSSATGCLIGTRTALLLPDAQVTTYILVRSGHPSHKQSDRNPRFDGRLLAADLAERFKANLFFFDVMPRVDDLFRFASMNVLGRSARTEIQIVDQQRERSASPHPSLSYTTLERIRETLENGQRILCVYNQKGFASQLMCQSCSHQWMCDVCNLSMLVSEHTIYCVRCNDVSPVPLRCSECHSDKLFQQGYGNRRIASLLHEQFPEASVELVDADHHAYSGRADITLVTSYFFENLFDPMRTDAFGLVAYLTPDAPLYSSSFRAMENTLHALEEWRSIAYVNSAPFLLQSTTPELFSHFYARPSDVFAEEQQARVDYSQPPTTRWVRVTFEDEDVHSSQLAADILQKKLRAATTGLTVLDASFSSSTKWSISCYGDEQAILQVLPIFTELPDQYIIDTHAFSC